MLAPQFISQTLSDVPALLRGEPVLGSTVTMASGQASGITPTTRHPPFTALVKKTSDGKYYLANSATNGADRNAPATVSSLIAIGAGAASKTFKWKYRGGNTLTVTGGAGDNTAALWVTLLNGNTDFNADLIASNSGATLIITARRGGPDEYFQVIDGTINGQGGAGDDTFVSNKFWAGSFADYRLTLWWADLADGFGVAADATVPTMVGGGVVKASLCTSLSAEAQSVLASKGTVFE